MEIATASWYDNSFKLIRLVYEPLNCQAVHGGCQTDHFKIQDAFLFNPF